MRYEYSAGSQRGSYLSRGNVLKHWNLERGYLAPRRNVVIHMDGAPVEVKLVRWDVPQQVVLTHLVLKDRTMTAAAVNIPRTRLLLMLQSMVALQ